MSEHEIAVPIMGIMLPLILVPTILRMKFAHRRREWALKERMRAMELGLAPPVEPAATVWPAMAAIAIGAGVPIAAMVFAWLAKFTAHASDEVYAAAGGVGIAGIICGSMLAGQIAGTCGKKKARPQADRSPGFAKPAQYDPDAYDTVSQRG
jgi:hypothetical protein